MKNLPSCKRLRRPQRAFTLVELMVTMAIAVFLLAGLFAVVQSTRRTYTNQTQLAQLQDSERLAMSVLTDVIQAAGYFPKPATYSSGTALPGGTLPAAITWVGSQPLYGAAVVSGGAHLDTISVRFATTDKDTVVNCLGSTNTTGVAAPLVYVNTFSLSAADASGNRSLQCELDDGNGNVTTLPLVYGVQNMQIYYGVKRNFGTSDNNVDTYLLGNEMSTTDAKVTGGGNPNDWMNVTAVRVILTFNNPLSAPSSTTQKTITFDRVIAVMNRAGPT